LLTLLYTHDLCADSTIKHS